MRHCAWEDADFPTAEFDRYRGRIYLHKTGDPVHLSSGELPDEDVDITGAVVGNVDVAAPDDTGEPV
jgi:hypothetical protein